MTLADKIIELYPWVSEGDARRIEDKCFALPPVPIRDRRDEMAYRFGCLAHEEAKKLKPSV
jgi:hypothetical protein